MSTTIDSLDIQISTSVGNSPAKIQELATALGNLKNQGKIGAATSAMKSLAKALEVLNPALSGLDTSKLKELQTSVSGLSGIAKLSGLSSALNTLKKLPDVMDGLDNTNLTKFTAQMERLSKALAPLATQIDKIGSGFSKLPNHITKAVNATNKMTAASQKAAAATTKQATGLNTSSLNLMSAIQNLESVMYVFNTISDAITSTLAQAMEWDGIQFRFGRAFGEDAEEVYAYAQKINDVLGINIQQFMQYSSLYGSLLSGFGMAQEKVTTISVGLTELSYDIWAAYNDRFKTLEDASEAVRSAITGEIEPIRNAGIALTEASLQEYMDQVGMATVSIEKLSEAQKAEVRYAAMMEAAMNQGIVGTYASEMHTAEGAVRNLSQAFKGLTQAFGSLFIPIIQAAIPWVTALINVIYDVIAAIASFFNISFFKIDWGNSTKGATDMASGLEKAAKSAGGVGGGMSEAADAAKKMRDYTMGFDELNVISPPDDTAGAGGGGGGGGGGGLDWEGLDLETLWDDSVFAKASQKVDELKQKILDWFEEWKTEIAIVAGALGVLSMATMLSHLGEALSLGEKFLGVMGTIKKLATTAIVIVIQYSVMTELFKAFIDGKGFKNYILSLFTGAIGTGILYSMWGPAGIVLGLGITAAASIKAVIDNGGITNVESATVALTGLASGIGAVWLAWTKLKDTDFGMFFRLIAQGEPVLLTFEAAFPKIAGALSTFSGWISTAASAVGTFLAGISAPVWGIIAGVIAAIASVALFLARNWDEVTAAAKKFFDQNIAPKLEEIKGHFEKLVDALGPVADVIAGVVEGLWESVQRVAKRFDGFLSGVGKVLEVVGGLIFSAVTGVIAGAFNTFVGIIENTMQVFSGIVQIIGGVIEFVVALFEGGDIGAAWQKIWDGVVDVISGIWGLIYEPIADFVNGIILWFIDLWDELVGHSIVPDTINAIVEWFCSLPEKIFGPVQEFCDGIIKMFKDMWDDVKQWYNTNVAPKFTRAYWINVFDKVVSGISSKLSELKGAIAEKWQTVVDWYNESVAPKLKLSYWTDKISSFLDVGKQIVENLKSGLKTAWEKLCEWWEGLELPEFKIKRPHLDWGSKPASGWIAETLEALGLPTQLPTLNVSWYAQGGFPGMGELFVAREAGPELVGKIGGRTAVANNDQIVAAVSQGVYSAVVAAMSSGGGNNAQNINVYLDGKQIYTSVKKVEAERGVSLMGNQLGYVY